MLDQRCTLKRQTADVSSEAVSMKTLVSTRERPARTPPSTFLFLPIHFSNSPGTMAVPTPRSAGEPAKLVHPRAVGCRFTVPVRSFRGAQSHRRRTARRWLYIGVALAHCQPERPIFLVHIEGRGNLRSSKR